MSEVNPHSPKLHSPLFNLIIGILGENTYDGIPRRVLRLPTPNAIFFNPATSQILNDEESEFNKTELSLMHILNDLGYVTVRTGKFIAENPWEIGIRCGPYKDDNLKTNEWLAKEAGVTMPKTYGWQEALDHERPVVAKRHDFHRGQGKYLLCDQTQKNKFHQAVLLDSLLTEDEVKSLETKEGITFGDSINAFLIDKVDNGGDIPENYHQQWRFEEFIEGPSPYPVSYRGLADASGHVYYVAMIISPFVRHSVANKIDCKDPSGDFSFLHWLLAHPQSPFFLNTAQIGSYVTDKSDEILLDGQQIEELRLRQIVEAHGVDPNHASAPLYVVEKTSLMAKIARGIGPVIGVDFIQDKDRQFYFLEGNIGHVGLAPNGLGLPENATYEECQKKVMGELIGRLTQE